MNSIKDKIVSYLKQFNILECKDNAVTLQYLYIIQRILKDDKISYFKIFALNGNRFAIVKSNKRIYFYLDNYLERIESVYDIYNYITEKLSIYN